MQMATNVRSGLGWPGAKRLEQVMHKAPFDEIVAPTAKELFVRSIESAILSGSLSIGELLPTTRELAAQMRISPSVVDAGIKEMVRKGFLEVVPRKGVFVANYPVSGNLETLAAIMNYDGSSINDRIYLSILEVRRDLEVPAVQRVASCRSEQQLAELKRIVEALGRTAECKPAAQLLLSFHLAICNISGNVIYPLIFKSFAPAILALWERYCRQRGIQATSLMLTELVGHIERRDPERAGQLIYAVISEALEAAGAPGG
jgi:DNA-binding FadR family transcriptional regulator